MNYHLTLKSSNRKTGCMPVSTSPRSTCPSTCPFRGKGCYAEGGPINIHWRQVSEGKRGSDWKGFLGQIKSLPDQTIYRHNQAGDLRGSKNRINKTALKELVAANKGKSGYTYTHYPLNKGAQAKYNRQAVKAANKQGFTINLSAESLAQADRLLDYNIGPVVLTLPSNAENQTTPKGHKVVVCPAQKNDAMTCDKCKLCAKSDRKVVVGFRSHGYRVKKIESFLQKPTNNTI